MYLVPQSCPTLCDPMDDSPPGSSVHGESPSKNSRVGCHALLLHGIFQPGIEPRFPTLQADSFLSEPPGKPKNTAVGSLSFFQGIFLTQGLKPGSPAFQEDSLPVELPGKPWNSIPIHTIKSSGRVN